MELKETVEQINRILSNESWLDMEVLEMKGGSLVIIGSTDFTYGHSLEIKFAEVFHMSVNTEWKTDTSKPVLYLVDNGESVEINQKYQIEQGNILFKILSEDIETPFYISAKNISFNTDSVLYYKKDNLKSNERIADWVQ